MKLIRVAIAAAVGSVLWAGCAEPRYMVADADVIAAAPIDQSRPRPDTHPELRSPLWQMAYQHYHNRSLLQPRVSDTSVVQEEYIEIPVSADDTTELLRYNPEVVNLALGGREAGFEVLAQPKRGDVIFEAAGAEPGIAVRTTGLPWRERVLRNKEALERFRAD